MRYDMREIRYEEIRGRHEGVVREARGLKAREGGGAVRGGRLGGGEVGNVGAVVLVVVSAV